MVTSRGSVGILLTEGRFLVSVGSVMAPLTEGRRTLPGDVAGSVLSALSIVSLAFPGDNSLVICGGSIKPTNCVSLGASAARR